MAGFRDKRDLNRYQRTGLANSGRAAGAGVSYDDYSEGEGRDWTNPHYCPQGRPTYTEREREEMLKPKPVKVYKISKKEAKKL